MAHDYATRDVVGGIDLSEGWSCRPAPCNELPFAAGQRRMELTLERRFDLPEGTPPNHALSLGHFATPVRVRVNGRWVGHFRPGLVLVERPPLAPGENVVAVQTWASRYRRRSGWDGTARLGPIGTRTVGLIATRERATRRPYWVALPAGLDEQRPSPLIVFLHAWGVGPLSLVGTELARLAAQEGIVLLAPDGLGNSLWVGQAEEEVLAALDALSARIAIDPDRIYLFGASMGGAGATTIGYRHPDRFAGVASFFGDSRYQSGSYTDAVLHDEAAIQAASCINFAENARDLPTLLVHGRLDQTSPLTQSTVLAERLAELGFEHELVVRHDRGHELRLVDEETGRMLAYFAQHPRAPSPERVSLRVMAPELGRAYWLGIEPAGPGWALADVAITQDRRIEILARDNVRRLYVDPARVPAAAGRHLAAPPGVVLGPMH